MKKLFLTLTLLSTLFISPTHATQESGQNSWLRFGATLITGIGLGILGARWYFLKRQENPLIRHIKQQIQQKPEEQLLAEKTQLQQTLRQVGTGTEQLARQIEGDGFIHTPKCVNTRKILHALENYCLTVSISCYREYYDGLLLGLDNRRQ